MEDEAEFAAMVQDVIATLRVNGPAPQPFIRKGLTINGWKVDSEFIDDFKGSADAGWWEEYTERNDIVLAEDGTIWRVGSWSSRGTSANDSEDIARLLRVRELAGLGGDPLAVWIERIKRLPG